MEISINSTSSLLAFKSSILKNIECDKIKIIYTNKTKPSQWNGDGSIKKKYIEFCQFRLILPIKICYIPNFKIFWSRA